MHPADLVEGLEDLQRSSDNLVTDLDLDRDTLLEVNLAGSSGAFMGSILVSLTVTHNGEHQSNPYRLYESI